ncbi:unnamed protein product [Gadus morhua 'NCC']
MRINCVHSTDTVPDNHHNEKGNTGEFQPQYPGHMSGQGQMSYRGDGVSPTNQLAESTAPKRVDGRVGRCSAETRDACLWRNPKDFQAIRQGGFLICQSGAV